MANPFSRWFLSERPPNCHVADLETSLDPHKTLLKVQKFRPTLGDWVHYLFLGSIMLFVFIAYPASWILKILCYCLLGALMIIPATSQFFFNALPILTWLALYFNSSYFPADLRPPITVKVLPAVETILYGDNLSDILATFDEFLFGYFSMVAVWSISFWGPICSCRYSICIRATNCFAGLCFCIWLYESVRRYHAKCFPSCPTLV